MVWDTIDTERLSPMMAHYVSIKNQYPDCIIMYRLGDFYEMFFDDAVVSSRVLELALTGRDCGLDERCPMAGVPHQVIQSYAAKLVSNGYKVCLVDQME
ncbi:MAG: DNA mismatch repair protein MutS, partial [Peptoniphilaceae bacterium]|nr:DNA mismatch repair protein MutS [Peptoniphilaceae bacterium]MDY5766655.1 DNA mismatch repair protein MutS [Peptoniphilaceae bacterium]